MFQRRLLIVASRLRSAQLYTPSVFSPKEEQPRTHGEERKEDDDQNGHTKYGEQQPHLQKEPSSAALFDAVSVHLKSKAEAKSKSILLRLRRKFIYVSFFVYLLGGTLFYMHEPGNELHPILAFYEAITIGFSVGLSPRDPTYMPNPWFSSCYILVGASLIAVLLTKVGQHVEEMASMKMFESLKRREDYEKRISQENPLRSRVKAFLQFNAAYLITIFIWIVFLCFISIWSTFLVEEWSFAEAQYFAISLSSSAGSFSMPPTASLLAYGLAALSMMIGVPVMALGISSVVIMLWQGQRFHKVKDAAWEPVTQDEVQILNQLALGAICDDEGKMTKGGFILLGLLRMGQDVGIMKYLADAYDASEERGGLVVRSAEDNYLDGYYSTQARAYVGQTSNEVEEEEVSESVKSPTGKRLLKSWSVEAAADDHSTRHFFNLSDLRGLFVTEEEKRAQPSMHTIDESNQLAVVSSDISTQERK